MILSFQAVQALKRNKKKQSFLNLKKDFSGKKSNSMQDLEQS